LRREQQPNVIVDKEEWDILSLFWYIGVYTKLYIWKLESHL
jgi:hypothetical protein